jgi:hypothetical protein
MRLVRRKRLGIRWMASIAVAVTYFLVTTGVDLFHNECCEQGQLGEQSTSTIFHNAPCPACAFTATSNSPSPMCQFALVAPQVPVICQPAPHQAHASRAQWTHSIVLRAPPTS